MSSGDDHPFDRLTQLRKVGDSTYLVNTSAALGSPVNLRSADDLLRHGVLINRPTGKVSLASAKAWRRILARQWASQRTDTLEFAPARQRYHVLRRTDRNQRTSNDFYNWCGSSFDGLFIAAWIQFTVPSISEPYPRAATGPGDGWYASIWVGLDGSAGENDIFQAGVELAVDQTGAASYSAWTQWVPTPFDTPIPSTSFLINQGDEIYVQLNYLGSDGQPAVRPPYAGGSATFANYTTGQWYPSIILSPPSGAATAGTSVEWVVESPGIGGPTSQDLSYLPYFYPTILSGAVCEAYPNNEFSKVPGNGTLFNLVNPDNKNEAFAFASGEDILVEYWNSQ